jgi:hypothetical protein
MKFSLEVVLPSSVPNAFIQLHNPVVFKKVSKPFLTFQPVNPSEFPASYTSGNSYLVRVRALGFLPLGTQEINPVSTSDGESSEFRDNGRGVSGALGVMRHFRHSMTLSPTGPGSSQLRDELEWDAGWLSPMFYLGFRLFWGWRHLRMKSLAKTW